MIYTVTLNPALDKTVTIPNFAIDTVNRIAEMRTDPGGKGINVSKVIRELGGQSVVLALLGGSTGKAISDSLEEMGLNCHMTFVPGQTRTNLKVIDPVNHNNTDINEPGLQVEPDILSQMLADLLTLLVPGDIVVLSGSLPKGAPQDTYNVWVRCCKEAGAKVFLDADGALMAAGMKAGPYLVKPNNDELSRLMGKTLETEEELICAAKKLLAYDIEKVVVSMGSKGALYVTREEVIRADGLKVPVGSTVGAGDSVVAALAFAEAKGMTLPEAVRLSTATGAANVMCSGSQAASWDTIEPLLEKVTYHTI